MVIAVAVGGVAFAGDHASRAGSTKATAAAAASRLDDGKALLAQAEISQQDAVAAAQGAASGALNEVDLEHYQRRLVWNVDVVASDVKVAASTGEVLAAPKDD